MATVATISVNFAQYDNTSFNAPGIIDKSINPKTLSQFCLGTSSPGSDYNYLGGFVKKTGDTMSDYLILPTIDPTLDNHATRKGYVDTRINSLSSTLNDIGPNGFVKISGSTMIGSLILNTSSPTVPLQSASKGYVDTRIDSLSSTVDNKLSGEYLAKAGGTMSGIINMSNNRIISLGAPALGTDAATKNYVDGAVGGLGIGSYASVAYVNAQNALKVNLDGTNIMTGYLKLAGNAPTDALHATSKSYVDTGNNAAKALANAAQTTANAAAANAAAAQATANTAAANATTAQTTANTAASNAAAAQTTANTAASNAAAANSNANTRLLRTTDTFTGVLTVNGSVVASGDVTAYSDKRLKTNISPIENALEKILKLNGVNFTRLSDDKNSIGLIAQEVQDILPEVVVENSDGYLSVAYANTVAVLIEAIKELNSKIEKLEEGNK